MSDGICMDEDIQCRCSGYGCPTLCRHGVHMASSRLVLTHVWLHMCMRLLPTGGMCAEIVPYSGLYLECVNMLFNRLTSLFQQRHVLMICSCFNALMWTVQLSGSIPPEIGKLIKLTNMYLNSNQVRGVGGWRDGDSHGAMSTCPVDATRE